MSKKKACRDSKRLVEGNEDPVTGSKNLSTNWQGRVNVINPEKSIIAKKMNFTVIGEYAIKVR